MLTELPPAAASAAGQAGPEPSRPHRRRFSRLGLGLTAYIVMTYVFSLAVSLVFQVFYEWEIFSAFQIMTSDYFEVVYYALASLTGFGVFWIIVRSVPVLPPEQRKPLPPLSFLKAYFVAAATLFLFNYLTEFLLYLIAEFRGAPIVNPIGDITELPIPAVFLLTCVVAPVMEELTYRRLLIPRLRPYGDRFAVLTSALCFSLVHGNLSQFLYAFALGIILGHVFLKTGCVWQTILLHALVNLVGGVVPTLAKPYGAAGDGFCVCFTLCHMGVGLFFFLRRARNTVYAPGIYPLGEGRKWRLFLLNFGMACFCLLCLIQAAVYLWE